MARPKKQTVDYFPHIIKQGKTMTILENRFGNDGYAFWFKLLEILGSTEGHCYRYENTADIEFLLAKTNVDRETAEKILDLLAELDAIDKELWEKGYIWSDNFIENIADVYKKRSSELPKKPVIGEKTTIEEEFSERKPEDNGVTDSENPQSKVKYSKVNNNNNIYSPAAQDDVSEKIPYKEIIDYLNMRTNSQYKHTTKKTRELIRARWNEGFRLEDFKTVVDKKCAEWMGDAKMEKYLRPVTLFGTKFESYLNQLSVERKDKYQKQHDTKRELYQKLKEWEDKRSNFKINEYR